MSFCKVPASLGGLGDTGSVAAAVYDAMGLPRIKGQKLQKLGSQKLGSDSNFGRAPCAFDEIGI